MSTLKIEGWRDSLVGKVLDSQAQGLGSICSTRKINKYNKNSNNNNNNNREIPCK